MEGSKGLALGQKGSRINIHIFPMLPPPEAPWLQAHGGSDQGHLRIGDPEGASEPPRRQERKKTLGSGEDRQGSKSVQGAEFL